jgi:hypothetical protein
LLQECHTRTSKHPGFKSQVNSAKLLEANGV